MEIKHFNKKLYNLYNMGVSVIDWMEFGSHASMVSIGQPWLK